MIADGTVALQLQQFLDDWHYRILHSSLGRKWPRSRVITSALDILILNGVPMTQEEKVSFAELDEATMLQTVAGRFPLHLRENFEHLALQLQMVVTMATRCRNALEKGDSNAVRELMEETDSTGLGQQVLKQGVVASAKQVAEIQLCQETWVRDVEKRLERLLNAAETAEHANQQLMAVEAQLSNFGNQTKSKGKKALMNMVEGNTKTLIHSVYAGWLGVSIKNKAEMAIRKKFEDEIAYAENTFFAMKKKRFGNISGVMASSQKDGELGLVRLCFVALKEEFEAKKKDGDTAAEIKALEARMASCKSEQSNQAKSVLARMNGDRNSTLIQILWSTWMKFCEDYKKDKGFEDAVKKQEQVMKAYAEKQKSGAMSSLNRMAAGNDTALLSMFVKEWHCFVNEEAREKAAAEELSGADGGLKSLQSRQLGNARGVQTRVNDQMNANLLMQVWNGWMLESKCNHIDRYYSGKIEGKRRQLNSVQTLFKSFARQLEEGLGSVEGEGDGGGDQAQDSSRGKHSKRDHKEKSHHMKESSSLPDIHHRPAVA